MSFSFRNLLLSGLVFMGAASSLHPQNAANATTEVEFSHEPCGNPMMENDLWFSIEGKVTSVEDGARY
jgi:hypothetical protein